MVDQGSARTFSISVMWCIRFPVIFLSILVPGLAFARSPDGISKSDWTSISEAYEAARHTVHQQEDGSHNAHNPGQMWNTVFDGRGFRIRPAHGQWTWGMDLQAVGSQEIAGMPQVNHDGNTLCYRWNERIQEWFINDQRGLEQGWTIQERIPGTAGSLKLDFRIRGSLRPSISEDQLSVAFQNSKETMALTYGGLKAWDSQKTPLEVAFVRGEEGKVLSIVVDDKEAVYPVTIDPVAQQAYIKSSNAGAGDFFGSSIAISGDTVVIGAFSEDGDASSSAIAPNDLAPNAGAAYVFTRNGGSWNQQAYLKAANAEALDEFGSSVAISGDTIVVGAQREDGDASSTAAAPNNISREAGSAYVFIRNGEIWSQQAYLKASNAAFGDQFGTSVAISDDTIVVGAVEEAGDANSTQTMPNKNAIGAGAAYIFTRSGIAWSQQAYLKASNAGDGDDFGRSVAISGKTAVVGAPNESGDARSTAVRPNEFTRWAGAVYIYTCSDGESWTQQAYLKSTNAGIDHFFGTSTAISGDTVLVGARGENGDATSTATMPNDNADDAGAAYIFVRRGSRWSQQAYLKAGNANRDDRFGLSVAIFGDTAVVGASGKDGNANSSATMPGVFVSQAGAAYVFIRNESDWSQRDHIKAQNAGRQDFFGTSVGISGDTVVVGAGGEAGDESSTAAAPNDNAVRAGAAYVFDLGMIDSSPDIVVEYPVGTERLSGGMAVDFSNADPEIEDVIKMITVRNYGNTDLIGLSLSLAGLHPEDYVLENSSFGETLAPGASSTFTVGILPTAVGLREAQVLISGNDPEVSPFVLNLTRRESVPEISLEHPAGAELTSGETSIDFGTGLVGSSSEAKTFTVHNRGTADLNGLSVRITGAGTTDYAVVDGEVVSTLAPGSSTTFSVTFTPLVPVPSPALLEISSSDIDEAPFLVDLLGEGITPSMAAQRAYLKAGNAGRSDSFGHSVAVSGDTIIVGAFSEDGDASSTDASPNDNANDAGAAYIFVRSGSGWEQQAYLKARNAGEGDWFGWSVGISGDTVAVGAIREDGDASSTVAEPNENTSGSGAVYIFARSGGSWSQQAYLKAGNAGGSDQLGVSVAISGDSVVVGATDEAGDANSTAVAPNDSARRAGAAYVFTRRDGSWSQEAYLKARNADENDGFGVSVGISGDTVIVGASGEAGDDRSTTFLPNNNYLSAGAAYIFSRGGGGWSQAAYLKANNPWRGDRFGGSVAISGDTVVVGARFEDGDESSTLDEPNEGAFDAGAAYVFTRNGLWSQQAYLKASNAGTMHFFGVSVAISGDAVVVGATGESGDSRSTAAVPNTGGGGAGAAYVFARSEDGWDQQIYLKASNTGSNGFGAPVLISGSEVINGAAGEDGDASSTIATPNENVAGSGAVYIFDIRESPQATSGFDAAVAAAGHAGTNAAADATPFHDGVSNLLKYAFNMDLSGPDSRVLVVGASGLSGLPAGGVFMEPETGQSYWQVEYLRRRGDGLLYEAKKSTTLLPGSFSLFLGTEIVEIIDDEWERVIINEPCDPSIIPHSFSRVEVRLP